MALTKHDVKSFGFKNYDHLTVMGSMYLDIGRRRVLTIGCIGTPNETVFICANERKEDKIYSDLVCLHNYDYDGYLTKEKLKSLVDWFGGYDE